MKQNITHTREKTDEKKDRCFDFFLSLANYDSNASNKRKKKFRKQETEKLMKNKWK